VVSYKCYTADSGKEFNGNIISIKNEDGKYDMCSGFFTVIPISPLSHRKKYKTKTCYRLERLDDSVIFTLFDDWGNANVFSVTTDDPALERVYDYLESEQIPLVNGG
jgi:hypothetical protein